MPEQALACGCGQNSSEGNSEQCTELMMRGTPGRRCCARRGHFRLFAPPLDLRPGEPFLARPARLVRCGAVGVRRCCGGLRRRLLRGHGWSTRYVLFPDRLRLQTLPPLPLPEHDKTMSVADVRVCIQHGQSLCQAATTTKQRRTGGSCGASSSESDSLCDSNSGAGRARGAGAGAAARRGGPPPPTAAGAAAGAGLADSGSTSGGGSLSESSVSSYAGTLACVPSESSPESSSSTRGGESARFAGAGGGAAFAGALGGGRARGGGAPVVLACASAEKLNHSVALFATAAATV